MLPSNKHHNPCMAFIYLLWFVLQFNVNDAFGEVIKKNIKVPYTCRHCYLSAVPVKIEDVHCWGLMLGVTGMMVVITVILYTNSHYNHPIIVHFWTLWTIVWLMVCGTTAVPKNVILQLFNNLSYNHTGFV